MGYVTNDPRRGDDRVPGGDGLVLDLGLLACPRCRIEVADWEPACPECGAQPLPKTSLGPALPEPPAHLLADDEE